MGLTDADKQQRRQGDIEYQPRPAIDEGVGQHADA